MRKNDTSVTNNIENLLCPFTDLYITQGADEGTHKGTYGVDVRGIESGVRYPYYAPCSVRCLKTYEESGQVMWQSISNVRCANGYVGVVTFMTAHDDSMDARPGQIVKQGVQLGNMGTKGNATGVHCHIEFSEGANTSWFKNRYGIYMFNNEKDLDEICFFDNTNILNKQDLLKPKYTNTVSSGKKYINLSKDVSSWAVYNLDTTPVKKNAIGYLNPKKFGGLTYLIYSYRDNNTTVEIETADFGRVKIYIVNTPSEITTDNPKYKNGSY